MRKPLPKKLNLPIKSFEGVQRVTLYTDGLEKNSWKIENSTLENGPVEVKPNGGFVAVLEIK